MEAAQKVALEPLASALGVAAFLHNVIIVHTRFSIVAGCFFMHYNATLCKEALGKKICSRRTYLFFKGVRRCRGQVWRKLRSVSVFSKNCASNFFWSVGKGVAIEM
jgi:hypothetical protein